MSRLAWFRWWLGGTVALFSGWQGAAAADPLYFPGPIAENGTLPAVSDVNGKWELGLGTFGTDTSASDSGLFIHGGASLTLPVGHDFGLQGDIGVKGGSYGAIGGAIHAFTRDPDRYLIGVTGALVRFNDTDATLTAFGPEGELYFDRFSLEGWAGVVNVDYDDDALEDESGFFGIGDFVYYPTDNWRLSLGGSLLLDNAQLRLGTEYQFDDSNLSMFGNLRVGEDSTWIATIGLKGYFGGDDPGKSLIDRQRQDDPRNRPLDLFDAAAGLTPTLAGGGQPPDPEQACIDLGPPWSWNGEACTFDGETV
jgi:hypothetical protein